MFPHLTIGNYGKVTHDHMNDVFEQANRMGELYPHAGYQHGPSAYIQHEAFFYARITGFQLIGAAGSNRWRYKWSELLWDMAIENYALRPNGRTSTITNEDETSDDFGRPLYNDWETQNDGSGIEGLGVDIALYPNAVLELIPIRTDLPVRVHVRRGKGSISMGGITQSTVRTCFVPNAWKITCTGQVMAAGVGNSGNLLSGGEAPCGCSGQS